MLHRLIAFSLLFELGCVGTIAGSGSSGPGGPGGPGDPANPGDPGNPGTGGAAGNPGDPNPVGPGGVPVVTAPFKCGTADRAVPATLKRLAKIQFVNAMKEFLSTLSGANLIAVMTKIDSNIKQLPDDSVDREAPVSYSIHDDRLLPDHVNALFNVGVTTAKELAGNPAYVADLVAVCGTGSTAASLATATCLDKFVNHYGLKTLKRPLTAAELADFKTTYSANGASGLGVLLARMFLHPRFYYHTYFDGTKVSGTEGVDGVYKLNAGELTAKVAFHFWNRPPDDALYALAAGTNPATDAGMDKLLDYVVKSPYAKDAAREFYSEWLQLDGTPTLKGSTSASLATLAAGEGLDVATNDHRASMIEEVLAMTEHYSFGAAGKYDDLMTSRLSFAKTRELAKLYGTTAWDGSDAALAEFPATAPRAGLLTRGAFLISGDEYTRPIKKGLKVLRRIMCETVPPPPADVAAFAKISVDVSRSTRQDIDAVISNPMYTVCKGCHESFTPLGYASENYDALGRFRTEEMKFDAKGAVANKVPIDTAVSLTIFNGVDPVPAVDAVEMGADIATSGMGQECLVRHYFRFTNGVQEDDGKDGCGLAGMFTALQATDGTLMGMFRQAAKTDSFRYRQAD